MSLIFNGPAAIFNLITFLNGFVTMHRVPFMSRGGFRDWGTITGILTFMLSLCGGNPDVSMEFTNTGG